MTRRILAAATVAAIAVLIPATAWAHIVVDPSSAPKGSFQQLAFRVPNETDNTDTTKIDIQLPVDHPMAFVSVQPKTGWTYEVKKTKLDTPIKTDDGEVTEAVTEITWSGGAIKPGEFDNFVISAGPMPTDTDELVFKAIQTYSDGKEVAWIEPTPADGSEPEHPAPTLQLTAATEGAHDAAPADTGTDSEQAAGSPTVTATPASTTASDDADSAKTIATIALVVAVVGLLAGIGAVVVSRRKSV